MYVIISQEHMCEGSLKEDFLDGSARIGQLHYLVLSSHWHLATSNIILYFMGGGGVLILV